VRRAFLLAAVVVFVSASTATATIVPQRGIAGVTIGMSQSAVKSVLGRPGSIERGKNEFGRWTILRYPGLGVTFQGIRSATYIMTRRATERTARGIGVGSPEAQVKARVPGVKCKTEFRRRHCYVGEFRPGRRVTDFTIKRGRVTRVGIGVVID
jgi:hypothetical protein